MNGSGEPVTIRFAGVVLAGGRSTRMGADKAFLAWRGRRLIDRQLDLLCTLAPSELLVSGRAGVNYAATGARVVCDAAPDQGPLGGLAAVLQATTTPYVVLLAVDLPAMTPDFLRGLLSRCRPGVGVVAQTRAGWEPLAAVYPREILPLVNARLARRELALQSLLKEAIDNGLLVVVEPAASELGLFRNLNTPNDTGE
jgi:molybdopterin-guanine dinucleotide biosynthesis protein A